MVWRILSVENFKMVFGVSKDESILEREKGQGYISIDGKMEQYEFPGIVLLETTPRVEWIEGVWQFVNVTESTMQIGGHATSAVGR